MHRPYHQAQLSYYTFKYDRRKGRRQLGVRPTDMAHLLPEAFSTFTLPVVLGNGSRSTVEGVPNVDWTYLFAHTVTVTQARHITSILFSSSEYEQLMQNQFPPRDYLRIILPYHVLYTAVPTYRTTSISCIGFLRDDIPGGSRLQGCVCVRGHHHYSQP